MEQIQSNEWVGKPFLSKQDSIPNNMIRGTNGEIYTYGFSLPVYYTFYTQLSFTAGQTVTITTLNASTSHVIELFSSSDPIHNSWNSSLSSSAGSLSVSIPANKGGTYFVRVRSFQQYSTGTVDITINGNSYPNKAISSAGLPVSGSAYWNFFTCKLSSGGDTRLWLEDGSQGIPGKIIGWNDDGGTTSDGYSWGTASRVISSAAYVGAGLVSAYSSSNPYSTCDMYLGLDDPSWLMLMMFADLAADNSFRSAPADQTYNCFAWSVGVTSTWINWMDMYSLSDFDSFFQGYGYTRTGATASNAAIALWGSYDAYHQREEYSHASVRKNPVITKPHGFEWESKIDASERVMHIKDALNGLRYGSILYYYKPISGNININQAANEAYFSQSDLNLIATLKGLIPLDIVSGFEEKYSVWKSTWTIPGVGGAYIRDFAQSEEYDKLLHYCEHYGKVSWPLFIDKLAEGDVFTGNLLEDLTYTGKGRLESELIAPYFPGETGKPLPSSNSLLIEYSKKLLAQEQINIQKAIQDISDTDKDREFVVDTTVSGQEILISLSSETNVNVLVKVYDFVGTILYEAGYNVSKGKQTFGISTVNFRKGLHVVSVLINGKVLSKKVII